MGHKNRPLNATGKQGRARFGRSGRSVANLRKTQSLIRQGKTTIDDRENERAGGHGWPNVSPVPEGLGNVYMGIRAPEARHSPKHIFRIIRNSRLPQHRQKFLFEAPLLGMFALIPNVCDYLVIWDALTAKAPKPSCQLNGILCLRRKRDEFVLNVFTALASVIVAGNRNNKCE